MAAQSGGPNGMRGDRGARPDRETQAGREPKAAHRGGEDHGRQCHQAQARRAAAASSLASPCAKPVAPAQTAISELDRAKGQISGDNGGRVFGDGRRDRAAASRRVRQGSAASVSTSGSSICSQSIQASASNDQPRTQSNQIMSGSASDDQYRAGRDGETGEFDRDMREGKCARGTIGSAFAEPRR